MFSLSIDIFLALIGIAVGIFVSRYYFQKAIDKKLTPYIYLALPVLQNIDPDVRKSLKIQYHEVEVADLFQLQFLIANEGQLAIRDCIEPLTLILPPNVKVFDATILHVDPKGRTVNVSVNEVDGSTQVKFDFPLLNHGNFFVVQLLLNGEVKASDLIFQITVDDLPPTLEAQRLPYELIRSDAPKIEWSALWVSLGLIVGAIASIYGIVLLVEARPEYFPPLLPIANFHPNILVLITIVLWAIGDLLLVTFGIALLFAVAFGDVTLKKPKFPLPSHLRQYPSVYFDIVDLERVNKTETSETDGNKKS